MVDLEWQTALYKTTKECIKFIPINVIHLKFYLDMYSYGLENTLKDMSNIYSGEIDNCNFRGARVSRVLTPQFPFEATIKNNSLEKLKDVAVWHQIGKNNFERLEIIIG